MKLNPITTRPAEPTELARVKDLCLEAFDDEAVVAWLEPDPSSRRAYLTAMLDSSLPAMVGAGHVILALDPAGEPIAASTWVPRDQGSDPVPDAADDERSQRMVALADATQSRRPGVSHLYLSSMATLPHHRGHGAGGAMIDAGIAAAKSQSLPMYLEASTPGSRRLYERCGFRTSGAPVSLPDRGPTLHPMWLGTTSE